MKLSYNFLKKFVNLPEDISMEKLAFDLTMRTVEVEGVISTAAALKNIVVGKILKKEKHPNADSLSVLQIDIGKPESVQIVCGGSNVKENQFVIVALPGSKVVWHGEGEPVEIKASKLRGVESFGMVCASTEVGLEGIFPLNGEHEIVDLEGIDVIAGDDIAKALGLDDIIIEIDNKSMTNRPDLWGHIGIARELASIYSLPLVLPKEFVKPEGLADIRVKIEDSEKCSRYVAIEFNKLKTEKSPLWLRVLLSSVGIRPINSLVDISNYIMLATGQPTHGFDKKLVAGEISARRANSNEEIELLDGSRLKLDEKDLVIADEKGAVALAGIMGGKRASIADDTSDMVLELACFEPIGIRKSASKHNVRTESSARNEKGIDKQRIDLALSVANEIIFKLYPDAKITAYHDEDKSNYIQKEIPVSFKWLKTRLGRDISLDEVEGLIKPLGFEMNVNGDDISVRVPSFRATGDVSLPDDVLEEVARMIGYENFSFVAPKVSLSSAVKPNKNSVDRSIREYLARRCGMQEIFTYPWVDEKYIRAAGIPLDSCLEILGAPSPEMSHIRNSLVPDMLHSVAANLRYFDEFKIFEVTQVFENGEYSPSESGEILPLHKKELCFAIVGQDPIILFRQAKGVIESLPRYTGLEEISLKQLEMPSWADRKAWLNIMSGEKIIGSFGILSLKSSLDSGIKLKKLALCSLNIDELKALPSRTNSFEPLPSFPLVEQDFSILVDESVSWATIEETIRKSTIALKFLEEYKGKQVPEGKKSISFRVWFGDDSKTLSSQDIEEKMNSVINKLRKRLGAEIRA